MIRKIVNVSSSSKGVTLPPAWLEVLKLNKGDKVNLFLNGNQIIIKKGKEIKEK